MARKASRILAELPDFIREPLRALAPGERLTCSEWADKHRVLDARSSALPGKWSNDVTPYLVDIMNEIDNPDTEEVVFVKPTQVGGTEVLQNLVGDMVMQRPGPCMVVYPTKALAEYTSENRLQYVFTSSPALSAHYRPRESKRLEQHFDSMYVSLVGAESPSELASRPIQYLLLDEIDKYPGATEKEADPISLATERTKTFFNRKVYKVSTPTLKSGQIWSAKEAADVEKHYFVPCPHCGEYMELNFSHISFPGKDSGLSHVERAEYAVYACQECGGVIRDNHKPAMLRAGEWRAVRGKVEGARVVAYWINTLYSPFVRWAEIVREFLQSKDTRDKLQNFRNSWMAMPWEDVLTKTDAELVMERQTDVPVTVVPEWARLLTGGMDVQRASVYWTVRAWGIHQTSQCIAHGQALTLEDAASAMDREYRKVSGESFLVEMCGVDSGDQTDTVYEFCMDHPEWAIPVKGSSVPLAHFRIATINKTDSRAYGTRLVLVDGDKYKTTIASRMRRLNGEGSWMVHAECDYDYAEQVTAEESVNAKTGPHWQLKVSHGDNHYLDAEVYAYVAGDLLHIREMHLTVNDAEGTPAEPAKREEGSWLGNVGDWFA